MYYVADTHAFLWYLMDSPKLSKKSREIFDLCDRGEGTIVISALVLLEVMDILDKKKVNLNFEEIISKITQASNFIISEINLSLILEANRIKGFKDIYDRVIVSTAKIFDAYLISKDRIIRKYYKMTIW